MATKILLKRGLEANLPSAVTDGQLLFTTDSGKIYLDYGTERIELYKGLETSINDLKELVGSTKVADAIANAIAALKAEVITNVSNADNSVEVNVTTTADGKSKEAKVKAKLSSKADNQLTVRTDAGEEGLYVAPAAAASEYSLTKDTTPSAGMAATYHLTKDGVNTGVAIDIPKDLMVQSGSVVNVDGEGNTGTFIKLVLNDAANTALYINAADLVEYVTSGSVAGDMVFVTVDPSTHKVTADITDGTVTKAKLHVDVQTSLGKADTALQEASITESATDGSLTVGTKEVAIHGLKSAAYAETTAFDAAGAATAVQTAVTGTADDASTVLTLNGVKKYAQEQASSAQVEWIDF